MKRFLLIFVLDSDTLLWSLVLEMLTLSTHQQYMYPIFPHYICFNETTSQLSESKRTLTQSTQSFSVWQTYQSPSQMSLSLCIEPRTIGNISDIILYGLYINGAGPQPIHWRNLVGRATIVDGKEWLVVLVETLRKDWQWKERIVKRKRRRGVVG